MIYTVLKKDGITVPLERTIIKCISTTLLRGIESIGDIDKVPPALGNYGSYTGKDSDTIKGMIVEKYFESFPFVYSVESALERTTLENTLRISTVLRTEGDEELTFIISVQDNGRYFPERSDIVAPGSDMLYVDEEFMDELEERRTTEEFRDFFLQLEEREAFNEAVQLTIADIEADDLGDMIPFDLINFNAHVHMAYSEVSGRVVIMAYDVDSGKIVLAWSVEVSDPELG